MRTRSASAPTVACQVGHAPNRRIETVAIAGGAPMQIQTLPGDASDSVWSPDGSAVALMVDDGQGQQLWIVGLDGGQTEVPLAPHGKVRRLVWSAI